MTPFFRLQLSRHERVRLVAENEALASELALVRREVETLKRLEPSTMSTANPFLQTLDRRVFIGCSTDKGYVEPTAVMLSSMDVNGQVPEATVVVSCFGLDQSDKQKLLTGAGQLAGQMRFFDVTQETLNEVEPSGFTKEYPPSVLGKLLIGDFIGQQEGRLLTLDSDMIVNASLRPLFELDMGDEFFAAVHDIPKAEDPNYFNSGLTLCELNMYHFHDIGRRCLRHIAEHDPHFPDQDALNAVVGDRWHRLDPIWNAYKIMERPFTSQDYEVANIAHFPGWKPWDHSHHPGAPLYNRYLARFRSLLAKNTVLQASGVRDLLTSSYEVLLGRELESVEVLRDRADQTASEILNGVIGSSEFTERVLPALRSGEPFPDGRFAGQPSLRQRLWAADQFGGDDRSRAGIEQSLTWRDLLQALLKTRPQGLADTGGVAVGEGDAPRLSDVAA